MEKLIKHTIETFEIPREEIKHEHIISSIPLILPMADHDMAYDTDELSINLLDVENTLPRNSYAYNNTYKPINENEFSYLLVLSTDQTCETTAKIFKIEWKNT